MLKSTPAIRYYGFIVFAFLLGSSCISFDVVAQNQKLSAVEFDQRISSEKNVQLIDLRPAWLFKTGHLKKAENIYFNDSGFEKKIAMLDKTRPVYVYDESDGMAEATAVKMNEAGIKQVFELKDGIMGWKDAGKTLVKDAPPTPKPEQYSEEAFNKILHDNKIVVADFSATWCEPCRMLAPVIDTFENNNKNKVKVLRVDVDHNHAITSKMQVTDLPTILLFKKGKLVWRSEGYIPSSMIEDAIKNYN